MVRRVRAGLKMKEADDVTARLLRFDGLVRRHALLREGRCGDAQRRQKRADAGERPQPLSDHQYLLFNHHCRTGVSADTVDPVSARRLRSSRAPHQ